MYMGKTYGYCRISQPKQNIERQERNIKEAYPDAYIISEAYTGRVLERPKWKRLFSMVRKGDTIVFDEVSRMSRDADDGYNAYKELYQRGVNLVFLKEGYINTSVYKDSLKSKVPLTGDDVDIILKAVNDYLMSIAEKQIKFAFEQAEREVTYLRRRTKEGLETARLNGKRLGAVPGKKLHTQEEDRVKEAIKKYSKAFGGNLGDKEVMAIAHVSHNTYAKYKKELKEERDAEEAEGVESV